MSQTMSICDVASSLYFIYQIRELNSIHILHCEIFCTNYGENAKATCCNLTKSSSVSLRDTIINLSTLAGWNTYFRDALFPWNLCIGCEFYALFYAHLFIFSNEIDFWFRLWLTGQNICLTDTHNSNNPHDVKVAGIKLVKLWPPVDSVRFRARVRLELVPDFVSF